MTEEKRVATILCMAYDSSVAWYMREIFEKKLGYDVITASSGDKAIEHVHKADFVISDFSRGGDRLAEYAAKNRRDLKMVFMLGSNHTMVWKNTRTSLTSFQSRSPAARWKPSYQSTFRNI